MSNMNVRETLGGRDVAPAPTSRIRILVSNIEEVNGQLQAVEDRLTLLIERSIGNSTNKSDGPTRPGPQAVPNGSFYSATEQVEIALRFLDKIRNSIAELETIL